MTIYIRNPYNKFGTRTADGTNHVVASDYVPVASYGPADNSVVYIQTNVQGSGVFISKNLILTAFHVVADSRGAYTLGTGPTNAGQFASYADYKSSSLGAKIGSITPRAGLQSPTEIATITTATSFQGELQGLMAVGRSVPSSAKALLAQSTVEGFPVSVTTDENTGKDEGILFADDKLAQPITETVLYKESVDASGAKNGRWFDSSATLGGGNSGGPLFVQGSDGKTYIAGTLNIANATGPASAQNTNATASNGAGGVVFSSQMVQSLTQAAKSADPSGGKSGWWESQPKNVIYASDSSSENLPTDDRSDVIVLGKAPTEIIGSVGDDDISGDASSSTKNGLRYTTADGDSELTKSVLSEVKSVDLTVEIGSSNYGVTSATVHDTQDGVSHQSISGVSYFQLTGASDMIRLQTSPVQVASNDPSFVPSGTDLKTPVFVDAGAGTNVFDIDYGSGSSGTLFLEGGADNDDFNISNADNASTTVIYGGGGNDAFNFSTSGQAAANVLVLNVSGLTEQRFMQIDTKAFKDYIDNTFGKSDHRIVILNPGDHDTLEVNGADVTDPSEFGVTSAGANFSYGPRSSSGYAAEPDAYQLNDKTGQSGPILERYEVSDQGYAPNQWYDDTAYGFHYAPKDDNFFFNPSVDYFGSGAVTLGIQSVSPGIDQSKYFYRGDPETSQIDKIDPTQELKPEQHTNGGLIDPTDLGPFYNGGNAADGEVDAPSNSKSGLVSIQQNVRLNDTLNITNFSQGMFGLGFALSQSKTSYVETKTLYDVKAWAGYGVEYNRPGDQGGGPNLVLGLGPDFAQTTVLEQNSISQPVQMDGNQYFAYATAANVVDINDYLIEPVNFIPDDPSKSADYNSSDGSVDFGNYADGTSAAPKVLVLDDLDQSDIDFHRDGSALTLYVKTTGASINIQNQFGDDGSQQVDLLVFEDGTTLSGRPSVSRIAPATIAQGATVAVGTATPGLSGGTLSLIVKAAPSKGTLSLSNGVVNYTAFATASDADSFTYQIQDQYGDLSGSVTTSLRVGSDSTAPASTNPTVDAGYLTVGHDSSTDITSTIGSLVRPGSSGGPDAVTSVSAASGAISLTNGIVTYAAPSRGTDEISFTVTDPQGGSATGTVSVTIDPGPSAGTTSTVVGHGQNADMTNLINGLVTPGLSGDVETITSVTGNATLLNGTVTYTTPAGSPTPPGKGAGGGSSTPVVVTSDSFTYTVADQFGQTATGSVNVTIDQGPTATTGQLTVAHDRSTDVTNLLRSFVQPGLPTDTETLTALSATYGATNLQDGSATYTSSTSGMDALSYVFTDQLGETASGRVDITVDPGPTLMSTAPAIVGLGTTTSIGMASSGLAGDTLSLVVTKAPAHGSLTLVDGAIRYTSASSVSAHGASDSFTYRIEDQYGDLSSPLTTALKIDPGPKTKVGTIVVGHDQRLDETGIVTGLISPGLPGDIETITAVTGNAQLVDGALVYSAPSVGPDSFTYTVTDQLGDSATGIVRVVVDTGPRIAAKNVTKVGHGQTVAVATVTPGRAGDTETLTPAAAGNGTLALANGVVTYTAPDHGADDIAYTITDQLGDTANGTLNVAVDPGPTAAQGQLVIGHDKISNLTSLLRGLVTPGLPGDVETLKTFSAARGSATLANGVATYTAPATGTDDLTYTVSDQLAETTTGTVHVTVDPGPTTGAASSIVALKTSVDLTSNLLGTVTAGLAGDSLVISAVNKTGTLGTVSLSKGDLVYTANGAGLAHIPANGEQADSFGYTVSDQYGDIAAGTFSITVTNPATTIDGPQGGVATIQGTSGTDIINAHGAKNTIYDNGGNDIVNGGASGTIVSVGNGDVVVNLMGASNQVTGGNGNVMVSGSTGSTKVSLGNGNSKISVGGVGNTIKLGTGDNTVDASQGNANITLGAGTDRVSLGGIDNTVTLNGSTAAVSGGRGNDTVIVHGGNDDLTFAGANSQVTLDGTVVASISDLGNALRIGISSSTQIDTISGFGSNDTIGVMDFQNGAGGYSSVNDVIAALHSDGHGGTSLALGTTGSIHFLGTAPDQLHASNFKVG